MEHTRVLPGVIGFIVLEAVNTVLNILPILNHKSEAVRKRYMIRASLVNVVLVAGLVAYFLLDK